MAGLIKRGKKYYLVYQEGQNEKRVSLRTQSYQIAKEKKHLTLDKRTNLLVIVGFSAGICFSGGNFKSYCQ